MLTSSTDLNMRSGEAIIAGCNRRSHNRSATAQACVPLLKTNSLHGVLVLGSNENGVCCEAAYRMTTPDLS